jgi:hypothetical protein
MHVEEMVLSAPRLQPILAELELNGSGYKLKRREDFENTYFAGDVGMTASFDRVLVIEDDFRSGYECETCKQTGKIRCDNCNGEGSRTSELGSGGKIKIKCSHCSGTGQTTCSDCNGKGELLVIPEVAKRRPTTGQIVSLGSEVKGYKLGEYVCYPNFCGEVWDLSGIDHEGVERTIVVRVMKEREILCKITGHLTLRRVKNRQSQISG